MSKRGELYVLPSFFVKEVKVSNEIQEKLLEAIDVLINNRLNQLDSSTTITATITGVLNNSNTQYSCEGNGDKFNATSAEDTSFAIGDSVYVLMSNERNLILGKVAADDTAEATLAIKNNYYSLGGNFSTLENYLGAVGISSYKKSDGKLIYELNNENSLINFSDLELAKFARYLTESDALLLQATFQTNLPIQQTRNVTGVYGLKVVLNFEQDDVQWTKTLYLNSSTMAGNPYQYTSPTQQYTIFKLREGEGRAFKNIQSIEFIGGNFVAIDDATKEDENIFCSNIKLTCLEPINKTDGYYIVINAPEGSCFNTTGNIADESLTITAEAYYNKTNISAACNYSWFVQDGRIDVGNIDYRAAAGAGWRYIGSEDIAKIFLASENQAEKNNYLCIATYNNQIIIKQPFNLFNIASNLSNVKIYSVDGKVNFSFNNAMANLLCTINDDTIFNTSYSFSWYKVENGIYNLIVDEITAKANYERMKQALQEKKASILDVSNASSAVNASKGVVITSNKLSYPVKNIIEDQITFVCQAYRNNVFIGQGNITLTNTKDSTNKIVVIENGNQVFQYNEAGVSPCSSSAKQVQEILPLTAQAFNMVDDPVSNNDIRSVTWRFPSTSKSMIVPPAEAELSNENYYINTTIDHPVSFTIKDNYDIFATENQITVIIQTRSGIVYTGSTNFTFTKIGNFGNNGTDLVAKIKPTANVDNLILYLNKRKDETSNHFYEDWVDENGDPQPSSIRINVLYDGITNKEFSPSEKDNDNTDQDNTDQDNFKSVIEALESLENIVDRASKCENWAEYIKQKYLSNDNNDIDAETKRASRTLYLDLRQVARNMKTVDELLFDYLDNYKSTFTFNKWNINEEKPSLKVTLYQSGVEVTPTRVRWNILGSTTRSKFLRVAAKEGDFTQCEISARTITNPSNNEDPNTIDVGTINNLLIQAEVTLVDEQGIENTCYNVYPINLIVYNNFDEQAQLPEFTVIEDQTLRSVMYDSDGRNPVYNSKRGAAITTTGTFTYRYWFAEGGVLDSIATAPMTIDKDETDSLSCNIIPNNTYNGEAANTNVHIILYEPEEGSTFNNLTSIFKEYGKPKIDIYIPIHFYLNRYGLASLNAWDGNHLEVNEEENYILAPQIGAGKKESDNTFTGLVMGEAKFYNDINEATGEVQPTSSTGLLGYMHGKQSVFINAEDGSAVFGLPEQRAAAENSYTEGRIVIQPGGESKIGMWTIGSRALYNINTGVKDETGESIGYNPNNLKRSYEAYGYAPYWRRIGNTWVDSGEGTYDIPNASIVIPPEAQGLVLSANPAFISAKTMPLRKVQNNDEQPNTVVDGYLLTDINLGEGDTVLKQGDSLEVQINPNSTSPFGIFRHTKYPDNQQGLGENDVDYSGNQYRYPLMGINHNGQLFVNSLQNGMTNLRIGQVDAFGLQSKTFESSTYLGHKFVYKDNNNQERVISKMFINKNDDTNNNIGPLYITAGQDQNNEYSRPISIHGKNISLFATEKADSDVLTGHRLIISDDNIELGHSAASSYVIKNRTVIPLNEQTSSGWDKYQDSEINAFNYYGSLFESNLSTIYKSSYNNIELIPGNEYYVNAINLSDIRPLDDQNSSFKPITRRMETSFNRFPGLTITKVCIPVHWNTSGIIDAVIANGVGVKANSDNANLNRDCFYYKQDGTSLINAQITPMSLLGKHFSSVLSSIIKILVIPPKFLNSNFKIEELELKNSYTVNNDTLNNGRGSGNQGYGIIDSTFNAAFSNLSNYTIKPSDLSITDEQKKIITLESSFSPPDGYSVYYGSDLQLGFSYVGSDTCVFLQSENEKGAFLGNILYWRQIVTRPFLNTVIPLDQQNLKADIPITVFSLNNNQEFTSAQDMCLNDWTPYIGTNGVAVEEIKDLKAAYNYLNIGGNGSVLKSTLNLPSNDFSLNVQNGLLNIEAEKTKTFIDFSTSKSFKMNTAGQTEIILNDANGNISLLNYGDGKLFSEISATKANSMTGSFKLEAWNNGTIKKASLSSDQTGNLSVYSDETITNKAKNSYFIQTIGSSGIDITASDVSSGYGAHNTKTAYLKLAPGSGIGTFMLQGGNNFIAGDNTGIKIQSVDQLNLKSNKSWISLHYNTGLAGNNTNAAYIERVSKVLQTNANFYMNGAGNNDWRTINSGAIIAHHTKGQNNTIIEQGTIAAEGEITAYLGVNGKQTSLSTHTHPFSLAGSVEFHRAGSAGTTQTYHTKMTLYQNHVRAQCYTNGNTSGPPIDFDFYSDSRINRTDTKTVAGSLEIKVSIWETGKSMVVEPDGGSVTVTSGASPKIDVYMDFGTGNTPVTTIKNYSKSEHGLTINITNATMSAPSNN